jgi:hypothetical protein
VKKVPVRLVINPGAAAEQEFPITGYFGCYAFRSQQGVLAVNEGILAVSTGGNTHGVPCGYDTAALRNIPEGQQIDGCELARQYGDARDYTVRLGKSTYVYSDHCQRATGFGVLHIFSFSAQDNIELQANWLQSTDGLLAPNYVPADAHAQGQRLQQKCEIVGGNGANGAPERDAVEIVCAPGQNDQPRVLGARLHWRDQSLTKSILLHHNQGAGNGPTIHGIAQGPGHHWDASFKLPSNNVQQGVCGFMDGDFESITLNDLMTPHKFYEPLIERNFMKLAQRLQKIVREENQPDPVECFEYFGAWLL